MKNRTLISTLAICAAVAFMIILLIYVILSGRNPSPRVAYATVLSLLPALVTLVVVKLTGAFNSRSGVASLYAMLFGLALIIQALVRT